MKHQKITLLVFLFLLTACRPAPSADWVSGDSVDVVEMVEVAPQFTAAATQPINSNSGLSSGIPIDRMIIKDAQMELLVADTDRVLAQVIQLSADMGGYVISSQTWVEEGYKLATVRLGVPVINFETALNTIRVAGVTVLQESASDQDVSAEFLDLETRLINLDATAARVRSFLEDAQTVEESLQVSAQLSELDVQIEQIKGQMRFYEGRAAFSTITVTLTPERPTPTPRATATATPAWSPAQTFQDAGEVSRGIGRGLVNVLIWISVVVGPYLLIVGLIRWIILQVLRKQR